VKWNFLRKRAEISLSGSQQTRRSCDWNGNLIFGEFIGATMNFAVQ
jgi:hypothetical protein